MIALAPQIPFSYNSELGFDPSTLEENLGPDAMVHLELGLCDDPIQLSAMLVDNPLFMAWMTENQRNAYAAPGQLVGLQTLDSGELILGSESVVITLPSVEIAKEHDDALRVGILITRDIVCDVLEHLVSLEPDNDMLFSMEEYQSHMAEHEHEIKEAIAVLRKYGEQIYPRTLDAMQQVFYSLANDERFKDSIEAVSVVRSYLNEAWDGIGPWQK